MFRPGNIMVMILLVTLLALIWLSTKHQKGKEIFIRKIAGLNAIDEAVGRATEMGRPVHFTTGAVATLYGPEAPEVLAGLSVLSHVATLTAKYNTSLIVTVNHPSSLPLVEEIVKQSYLGEGKFDDYRPSMIRHLSAEQQAYIAGVQGIMTRERIAANIMIGPMYAESLIMAETAFRIGAVQVGGTGTRTTQLPFLFAVCDFTLIGEEIYAAGAYLSRKPDALATLLAEDITKFAVLAILVLGAIATIFTRTLVNVLSM